MGLEQTRACFAQLMEQQWFREMRAVHDGQVALVDGNQYFNRPGPRLVDGLEWLVGWLQGRPQVIPEGFVWELAEV
jgi:iron complex transport system substrate-binding protein